MGHLMRFAIYSLNYTHDLLYTSPVAESGIVWSLSKNYRVRDFCAGTYENIEFAQKKKEG